MPLIVQLHENARQETCWAIRYVVRELHFNDTALHLKLQISVFLNQSRTNQMIRNVRPPKLRYRSR